MKHFLPSILLLAGSCAGVAASPDTSRAAVTAYLKKNLSAPASYQPVRWSKSIPLDKKRVNYLFNEFQRQRQLAGAVYLRLQRKSYADSVAKYGQMAVLDVAATSNAHKQRADMLNVVINEIGLARDTTRLGVLLTHTYLYQNIYGVLAIDSAAFVVYKSGQVKRY